MRQIMVATIKGILRDRIFWGILVAGLIILSIPSVSTLSMRQVPELAITLSLSCSSFMLLLLTTFLGGTVLWKDIERRYTYSTLTLPISRSSYLLGKFLGVIVFMLLSALFLSMIAVVVIKLVTLTIHPDRPVLWGNILVAVAFDALKYMLLTSFAFLFSTFSTSFFLPIFGTIAVFLVGSASQDVFEFVTAPTTQSVSPFVKAIASALYYILPNFSAFDLKVYAIYSLDLPSQAVILTACYWIVYLTINLSIATIIFGKSEIK